MAPSSADIIRSDQFKFLVGKDQMPIMVHGAALAATSTQMERLINGSMKEADERCAELRDVGVDDFTRFCEYAYRGDYAAPPYIVDEGHLASEKSEVSHHSERDQEQASMEILDNSIPPPESEPLVEDWSGFTAKKKKPPKPSKKSIFRTNYQGREYLSRNAYEAETTDRFRPQFNTADEQDFAPVFLAHARLYTFARIRFVENLKALTLSKLHKTLVGFRLYENRVGDIIELARYAYSCEDIPDRAIDGKVDELRDLITSYIASEFDVIGKAAVFVDFLEEGGEFAGDFCSILLNCLV